jgi:alpha-beta hydrolase superfamily lysophospholipase
MKYIPFILAACLAAGATAARAGELIELPTRPGVTQSIFLEAPAAKPPWVVVLFAGGDGAVELTEDGPSELKGNFLLRTAFYWSSAGEASAIFDAPSDNAGGMSDPFRLGEAAAQDAGSAVAALRQRFPGSKIALLGTSRGTITVGSVLKRNPSLADAYVLTSPVTQSHKQQTGLAGMRWKGNTARVLVVSNENDGCSVSPFSAAKDMAADNGFDFAAV